MLAQLKNVYNTACLNVRADVTWFIPLAVFNLLCFTYSMVCIQELVYIENMFYTDVSSDATRPSIRLYRLDVQETACHSSRTIGMLILLSCIHIATVICILFKGCVSPVAIGRSEDETRDSVDVLVQPEAPCATPH